MTPRMQYAQLVRHFLSGRMTNHEYEKACDAFLTCDDEAVGQVYDKLWNEYCDLREHRMGRRYGMTREGRRTAARWILFLRSGRPYEYRYMKCPNGLVSLLTLGLVRRYENANNDSAERDYWPYYRRSDFETDLRHPGLLAGRG